MKDRRRSWWIPRYAVYLAAIAVLCLSLAGRAQQISRYQTIRIVGEGVLNEKGDLKVNVNWKFPTNADYLSVKRLYPSPYILFR